MVCCVMVWYGMIWLVCGHAYTYVCMCVCTYVCMLYVRIHELCMYMHVCTCMDVHAWMYACVCAYMHVRMYVYMYLYVYTDVLSSRPERSILAALRITRRQGLEEKLQDIRMQWI